MSDASSFHRSSSSGVIPTSSPDMEPITSVPTIPVSPFSASINPIEDAVPVKSDLLDVEDSVAAVDAESNHGRNGWITECLLWFASCRTCCRRRRFQSDYIVILGNASELGSNTCLLSDPRLKPKIPKLLVASLVLLSLGGILCVFFLVPRGVTLVDPQLDVVQFTLNTKNQSYNLVVNAYLPFHNPNYVGVDISGNVQVTYYQANAGVNNKNFTIPKRATTNVTITVDASNVPMKYISTVLQHCFSFPYQLVFFIDGTFKAKYLLQSQSLSVDAYKFIHCPVSYYNHSVYDAEP